MNETLLRQLLSVAVFNLPTVIVTFALVWFVSGFFPPPKANWKHAATGLMLSWLTTVAVAPFFSRSADDYMSHGISTTFFVVLASGLVALWVLPRLALRSNN